MLEINRIYHGDCLEIMKQFPDKSIDLIICDLPYGITNKNKWDIQIPFDYLWKHYERIIKNNGAILLFGQGKFTAKLILSNEKLYRYNLVWNKEIPSGFLNANKMPLRSHEDICIFYKKLPTYNPQLKKGNLNHSSGHAIGKMHDDILKNNNYGNFKVVNNISNLKYPKSIIHIKKDHPSICIHPTQKPVQLYEYLIKTYSNSGDLILDNCAGSFTIGEACDNINRNWIGIEKEEKYCKDGLIRINKNREKLGIQLI